MIPTHAAQDPDVSVWWIGNNAAAWREAFMEWIRSPDSPRRSPSTWRIHSVPLKNPVLPRITTRWTGVQNPATSIVVWTIPSIGIADLLQRIDHTRHTRPGYTHLSAGLASPNEQRILSEVGIRSHVQDPRDWKNCRSLFGYSNSPLGSSNSSIAGSSCSI